MPKPILKHQTQDGVVHTRQTARTYTHVLVWTSPEGKLHVTNWIGRPDLVAAALSATSRYHAGDSTGEGSYHAEPINGGIRA